MAFSKCKLELCRHKRKQNLQRQVQETLCLTPPVPPIGQACGNCSLTFERQKQACRQYHEKLRMNRILQVRAQERLSASQRVAEFEYRKTEESKLLLNHLKGSRRFGRKIRGGALKVWRKNLRVHAGVLVLAMMLQCWSRRTGPNTYGIPITCHKERELKERKEREYCTSTLRRKIVESVSSIERSFARRYNHGAKLKPINKQVFGCFQTVNPPVTHDTKREKSYHRLAGFPADFRDTYLHSRFDVLQYCTNQPSSAVVNCPEQEEVDAWRAADARRERNRCERAQRVELERLYNERSLERGTAAAAKLLNDQRMAMLEQEVEEAFREEEREKDRLHAATNSGICKPETFASQERRIVYMKHKISNPLSCPDSVITEGPEYQQDAFDDQTVIAKTEKEPEPLLSYPVPNAEKHQDQNLPSIGTQEKTAELADLARYQLQQGVQHEVEKELNDKSASKLESFSGEELKPSAKLNVTDAAGLFLELEVTKSPQQFPAQSKRKGVSPIRASCGEHGGLITARDGEGNLIKSTRVKSHIRCSRLNKALGDVISNESTSKGQMNSSKRGEKNILRPTKRWRARENDDITKSLTENVFPNANRCHVQSVPGVEEVCQAVHSIRATQSCVQDTGVEIQKSLPESLKVSRPPFISSGTVGYKKIFPESFMPQSSRPAKTSESEGRKATSNKERTSSMRSKRMKLKRLSEGPDLDDVKESVVACKHASSPRERCRPLSGPHAIDSSEVNKDDAPPKKGGAYLLPPYSEPPNPCENNASKAVKGEMLANCEDQSNDMEGLRKDSTSKVIIEAGFPRNGNNSSRSNSSMCNNVAGVRTSERILKDCKSGDSSNKGNDMEHQEKAVQELKLKQKAVWKSFINEKMQTKKNRRKAATGNRSIKSEPSSPALRIRRAIRSRPDSSTVDQDNFQSEARSERTVAHSNVRDCFTPGGSDIILPMSRSRFSRGISVPRSWKYFATNSKGIEVEALENITSTIKSFSKRSLLSVKQVPLETGPLRSQKGNFKEAETSHSSLNSEEREGSVKRDEGSKFSGNTADKWISTWKTEKYQEDIIKGMKRVKELISVPTSQGTFNWQPWLSIKLPRKSTPDQEMRNPYLEDHGNETDLSQSPMTCSKNKILLSYSPARTIDRVMGYKESDSANPSSTNRPNFAAVLSPKSSFVPKVRKSSPMKKIARVMRKESSSPKLDPWEAQSLDFVLGSLTEQVKDLDERLRSATSSSPASRLTSSLSRDLDANHPILINSLSERLLKDHDNSFPSVASSPERYVEESSCSSPAARNIGRSNARSQKDSACSSNPFTASERPASTRTYMDDRKTLLSVVGGDHSNSPRRKLVTSSRITQNVNMEGSLPKFQDEAKKTKLLSSMRNKSDATKLTTASVSSSSVSTDTSGSRSETSQKDTCKVNVVMVKKGRTHVIGNDVVDEPNAEVQRDYRVVHERFNANDNTRLMGVEKNSSDQVEDTVNTARGMRETKTYEKRDVFHENSFREDDGIKRALQKRLAQSRWTQHTRENDCVGVKERLEKRTVEVRGCTPQQIIHRGCGVLREQLVKEVVENGLPFLELNGNASFRRSTINPHRERIIHEGDNDKRRLMQLKRVPHELSVPQQVLSNENLFTNDVAEGDVQPRGHATHVGNNGHAVTTKHLCRKPKLQRAEIQARVSGPSNGESPVWEEESSSSGSWKNGCISWNEVDGQMLLSGSVDFSPWRTERLPDIATPLTVMEDSNCSKLSSPVAAEAADIKA
uniref:Uncharacterized protein n=1 Tax=Physcomitrium patens TaxID=3218 RepID=A0A2K1KBH0_PHYPA|nr:hypothetical protein PHYPA_010309 [Physcomitrium patens]